MWGEGGSFSLTAAALMIDSVLKRAMKHVASLWVRGFNGMSLVDSQTFCAGSYLGTGVQQ